MILFLYLENHIVFLHHSKSETQKDLPSSMERHCSALSLLTVPALLQLNSAQPISLVWWQRTQKRMRLRLTWTLFPQKTQKNAPENKRKCNSDPFVSKVLQRQFGISLSFCSWGETYLMEN